MKAQYGRKTSPRFHRTEVFRLTRMLAARPKTPGAAVAAVCDRRLWAKTCARFGAHRAPLQFLNGLLGGTTRVVQKLRPIAILMSALLAVFGAYVASAGPALEFALRRGRSNFTRSAIWILYRPVTLIVESEHGGVPSRRVESYLRRCGVAHIYKAGGHGYWNERQTL